MTTLFQKTYDAEGLYDLGRDMHEALDPRFNPGVEAIPVDRHGFQQGAFIVTIEWRPEAEPPAA